MILTLASDIRLLRPTLTAAVVAFGIAVSAPVFAQDGDAQEGLTVEELEAYIAEQKEALETVKENRELTQNKIDEVQKSLDVAAAREEAVKAELEALCDEREQLEAGSGATCREQNGL